ncbi:hypothetical protein PPERSA_01675 [Pseudocohnilembus persalinus]|uniref:C2H2-type domain-containing protein n=1 Tax=Pseudocohnilembus persalinus TaxID=266149 RepID=A0A0V0R0R4_PSEPJ|nr:hypothetical protein PPERSA_01675 [Pseudocohnilembus persalinus]|eukprot:KRX08130.1 hypothetical protein PPERSA_01675 [Pseudocohnilembus persalinus]
MGRKKRDTSYLLPFCYYCDKSFNNEIILHQHQKATHFRCQKCTKKFSTAESLKAHLSNAHKEQISKIPKSIQNRDSSDLKIFGMQGVPRPFIKDRILMGATSFWKKFINEKEQEKKKELKKQKQEQKEAQKLLNQQRQLEQKQQYQEQEQQQNYAPQQMQPITLKLQGAKKQQTYQSSGFGAFDEED